jgi:hypothetical protein
MIEDITNNFLGKFNANKFVFDNNVSKNTLTPLEFANLMMSFYNCVYMWKYSLITLRKRIAESNNIHKTYCVKVINDNIFEEGGEELDMIDPIKAHVTSYINFLIALGLRKTIDSSNRSDMVCHAFRVIVEQYPIHLAACILGSIELIYIPISDVINNYCVLNNIQQDHYKLHEIIDRKHSLDLYEIAEIYGACEADYNEGYDEACNIMGKFFCIC